MKKSVAVLASAAVACSTLFVAAAPASASTPKSRYLAEARRLEPSLKYVNSTTLWRAGKRTCTILDQGGGFTDVINEMNSAGVDSSQGAAVVVAAVHNLCQGHRVFLNQFLAQIG